jgi:methylglutaconyl-CoA hydratase
MRRWADSDQGCVEGCALGEKAENAAYELVVRTKDRDEALLAFREKRKPVFKGE